MIKCPACGSAEYKEAKSCSQYGQTVCMECCSKCEYSWLDDVYIMWRCSYGVEKKEQEKNEIAMLRTKIEELDIKQDDLYRRGYWQKAEVIVWEIMDLKKKLEALQSA